MGSEIASFYNISGTRIVHEWDCKYYKKPLYQNVTKMNPKRIPSTSFFLNRAHTHHVFHSLRFWGNLKLGISGEERNREHDEKAFRMHHLEGIQTSGHKHTCLGALDNFERHLNSKEWTLMVCMFVDYQQSCMTIK